jgi:hypothetical protein
MVWLLLSDHTILVVFLQKTYNLNLTVRKHQSNPNREALYKITGLTA